MKCLSIVLTSIAWSYILNKQCPWMHLMNTWLPFEIKLLILTPLDKCWLNYWQFNSLIFLENQLNCSLWGWLRRNKCYIRCTIGDDTLQFEQYQMNEQYCGYVHVWCCTSLVSVWTNFWASGIKSSTTH